MSDFSDYVARRRKWAAKGVGGTVSWVSLSVGAVLAISILVWPDWFKQYVPEQMSRFVTALIPLLSGGSVFLFRWFISPYFVFRDAKKSSEEKLREYEERKPDFHWERDKGHMLSSLGVTQTGEPFVAIDVKTRFKNRGNGMAYCAGALIYGCWLTTDAPKAIAIHAIESIDRTPVNGFLQHSTRITHRVGGTVTIPEGKVTPIMGSRSLLLSYEIHFRINSHDGELCQNARIWIGWTSASPNNFVVPNPKDIGIAEAAIEALKKIVPSGQS